MRVSTKALAPLSALLFFSSCVTPPPMAGPSRSLAYGDGQGRNAVAYGEAQGRPSAYASQQRGDRRPYQEPSYTEPSYQRDRQPSDGYVDDSEFRLAESRSDDRRYSDNRDSDGRFDDGRFAIPRRGDRYGGPAPASYGREPAVQDGYYDDQFIDSGPPHERGDYVNQPNGRISFLFGRRQLDDDLFEAAENPFAFGVEFSQVAEPGTLGFEFGFGLAKDEDDNVALSPSGAFPGGVFNVERDMGEIYGGFRAEFGHSNIRPYIGGGGTLINMSERRSQGFLEAEDDDNTVGAYLHGGVQVDLNEAFFIGVDFRRVFGSNVELFERKYDTDYTQLAFTLGVSL